MVIDSILAQIDAEIAKLTQVRSLLANTGKIAATITERLTKKAAKIAKPAKAAKAAKPAKVAKAKKRRTLSPEARQRIADAQRKRWAAQKAKA
jgi:formylmethanofuran dehydrogenase subunit E